MSVSFPLNRIEAAFEPLHDSWAYDYLGRSLYDVNLSDIVTALTGQDEAIPILTANALRHQLIPHVGNLALQWEICNNFTESACSEALEDPEAYGKAVVSATRNTPKFDESRRTASGMVYFGGGDVNACIGQSMGYGLLWAFEKQAYEGHDTSGKLVGSFGVRNVFGIDIRGDWGAERVHPSLNLNTAIEAVLISYDGTPNDRNYTFEAKGFLLEPDRTAIDQILIKEQRKLKTKTDRENLLKNSKATDFETVGVVSTDSKGSVTVVSSAYYQDIIGKMLEHAS